MCGGQRTAGRKQSLVPGESQGVNSASQAWWQTALSTGLLGGLQDQFLAWDIYQSLETLCDDDLVEAMLSDLVHRAG